MKINNNILIIGAPNSGKTTFLAQLYSRMVARTGVVKLARTPQNITGIKQAVNRLADGLPTQATPATENVEIIVPVKYAGEETDLVFKDYGGEQIREITELLQYDKTWQKRAEENDRWILFIRPGELYHHYDLSISGYAAVDSKGSQDGAHADLSNQYRNIELIQSLLHARGTGIKNKINTPRLVIALTCWDELKTEKTPDLVLHEKMPLFYHFISTLWRNDCVKIVGLSAQGFSLDSDEAREKYIDEMPETFGYIIDSDNEEEDDLTKLIEIALQL